MMASREDTAWLAGFVDGDGCFTASRTNTGIAYQFVVTQNGDEEILHRAHAVFGLGAVTGPYFREGRKTQHRFVVYGFEKVQAIGAALWPWLSTKKREQWKNIMERM